MGEQRWPTAERDGGDPDLHVLRRALLAEDKHPSRLREDDDLVWPQKYSRIIDFITAHTAMVSYSPGVSVRDSPSIMGSSRCLTLPSRPLIQPPLHPSRLPPYTTAASIAAITPVNQVLSR